VSHTELSIVVPLYNEAENLPELQTRIVEVMETVGKSFEIIYCDDGSSDESRQIISGWATTDDRVKLISFRRNFGQTAALAMSRALRRAPRLVVRISRKSRAPRAPSSTSTSR